VRAVSELDVHHAYRLAGRFSKAAVVIVESARGLFALGDSARPSSLLPVLIKDRGRLYCFFGNPGGGIDMDMVNPTHTLPTRHSHWSCISRSCFSSSKAAGAAGMDSWDCSLGFPSDQRPPSELALTSWSPRIRTTSSYDTISGVRHR